MSDVGCPLHGTAITEGCPGCSDYWDDMAIAVEVRRRLASDTGERMSLDALLDEFGYTRAELEGGTPVTAEPSPPDPDLQDAVVRLDQWTRFTALEARRNDVSAVLAELVRLQARITELERELAMCVDREVAHEVLSEMHTQRARADRLREALTEIAELRLDESVPDINAAIFSARLTMQAIARRALAVEPGPGEPDLGGAAGGRASGTELISAERQRQVEGEGWTPEHDDEHTESEMAWAAASYAIPPAPGPFLDDEVPTFWDRDRGVPSTWPPSWDERYWKPTPDDRVRELVKAGALIAAEIDRLLRAAVDPGPPDA